MMKVPESGTLVKGNSGQYGFYRVNYDDYGWKQIISLMNSSHKVTRV